MKKYQIIYADPPWQYRKSPNIHNGHERNTAEDNYMTMSMEQIANLPVSRLLDDNAALFLWITNPRLFGDRNTGGHFTPFHIMKAWGFDYRTTITWIKEGALGMGAYFRINTEHILFGIHKAAPIPPSLRKVNIIYARRDKHSQKPKTAYELIEQVYPNTTKLELFAREKREGWDAWGNEVDIDENNIDAFIQLSKTNDQ